MDRSEIIDKLNLIFRKVFKDGKICVFDEMTADDVERWDSLSHLILISTTEEEFGVKFKLKELIAMKNVGDFIKKIDEKLIS